MNIHDPQTDAEKIATQNGHQISVWINTTPNPGSRPLITAQAQCEKCGNWLYIDLEPAPGGLCVSGSVVARDCHNRE